VVFSAIVFSKGRMERDHRLLRQITIGEKESVKEIPTLHICMNRLTSKNWESLTLVPVLHLMA